MAEGKPRNGHPDTAGPPAQGPTASPQAPGTGASGRVPSMIYPGPSGWAPPKSIQGPPMTYPGSSSRTPPKIYPGALHGLSRAQQPGPSVIYPGAHHDPSRAQWLGPPQIYPGAPWAGPSAQDGTPCASFLGNPVGLSRQFLLRHLDPPSWPLGVHRTSSPEPPPAPWCPLTL